ncbi:MAG: hypothetical protein DHS20C02_15720 [Micavibrio sp.]|nr:MAG: hypothetical protein DHS20C02_15720 [Micavibrio sp.]
MTVYEGLCIILWKTPLDSGMLKATGNKGVPFIKQKLPLSNIRTLGEIANARSLPLDPAPRLQFKNIKDAFTSLFTEKEFLHV